MDFEFTDEQVMFRDAVRGIAERHLADDAVACAHRPGFPFDRARLFAEHGLMGITIAPEDGGQGGTLMDAVIAIEEVARVCPRSADVVQAGSFGAIRTLAEYATAEQKARFLPPLLEGRACIGLGMTEADAGSAVTDLETTAVPDGDGFRVTGGKVFTSHSPEADLFLVYVRYGPGTGGIGSVVMERGTEGLTFGRPVRYMNGEEWCPLFFDDVSVGPENVLLGRGGFKKQIGGFNVERIGNAARSLALGRHAFKVAREHVLTRGQFGRPLAEFQGIQWKFAEMRLKLDSAALLLYRAATRADRALPSAEETAIAKLACNRAGFEVANDALQAMGGAGYCDDSIVEYCFRKTRGWMIAGGANEMMLNRIAEAVFGRRFSQRPAGPGAAR